MGLAMHPAGSALAVRALGLELVARQVAARLRASGLEVLLLKGPGMQNRLYGSPAVYRSTDVDLLMKREDFANAAALLAADGWRALSASGVFWRASRAVTLEKDGVLVDLHWGLHAAHLSARVFRKLERELWRGAEPTEAGYLQPRPEPLALFLALHAAGHNYARPEWAASFKAAAALVEDRRRLEALAAETRLRGAAEHGLGPASPRGILARCPLDGAWGKAAWVGFWFLRGHFLPGSVRDRLRPRLARMAGAQM